MFFTVSLKNNLSVKKIINKAKRNILFYNFGATEEYLNKFIIKNYKLNLKLLCLLIISRAKYDLNNNKVTVLFKTAEDDKIARLITYGSGKIKGSQILKSAFKAE